MNKNFGNAALAASLLTVLTVSAAHAQTSAYDSNGSVSQLGAGIVTTDPYTIGDTQLYVPSPYTVNFASGGNTATFTATAGDKFESFTNNPPNSSSPLPLDFPAGTQVLNTYDAETAKATAPLKIDFGAGVYSFGLSAQDYASDQETFTFSTFNGQTLLNTFVLPTYDNTVNSGKSVFIGAYSTGSTPITSVLLSSASLAGGTYTGGTNDFYFGPVSLGSAPVPEASTTVSFGLLLMLGVGGAAFSARRKAATKASTA